MRNLAVSFVVVSSLACLCGTPNVDRDGEGFDTDEDADEGRDPRRPGANRSDRDGDGFDRNEDCNDFNPDIHPGAEDSPYDGLDQDCDGWDLTDADGDGFDSVLVGADDCDDNDPDINPGEHEIYYDDIDNDCLPDTNDQDLDGDGVDVSIDCDDTDPSFTDLVLYYDDIDGDGYGAGDPAGICGQAPADKVLTNTDCDDSNAYVSPGAPEICGDGFDSNCDGDPDPVDFYEPNDTFEEAPAAAWDDSDVFIAASLDETDMVDIYIASVTDDAEFLVNNFYIAAEITVLPNATSVSLALYNPSGYLVSFDDNPTDGLYVAFGAPDISLGYGGDYAIEFIGTGAGSCGGYTLRTYNGY